MKILTPGHHYRLSNRDGGGSQDIRFVTRRGPDGELLPEGERFPGLMSQDLLRVLIDRNFYLSEEVPCAENVEIAFHLRKALELYEARAARRSIEKITRIEFASTCDSCGHILCHCDKRRDDGV